MAWSEKEKQRLRELTIDPARHGPEDLSALVHHFRYGGTLFSVTDRGEPVHKSQEFARKIRSLTGAGKMDWLLDPNSLTPEREIGEKNTHVSDLLGHRMALLEALKYVEGIEPFPLNDRELVTSWSRTNVKEIAIPKGIALRQSSGTLVVTLNADARSEWPYLREHLAQDILWTAIENCKEKLATDLLARFRLLDVVAELISRPIEEGGLALAISPELGFVEATRPEVTIYYAFTIFHQVLAQCLGFPLGLKRQDEFVTGAVENTAYLGGIPVIRLIDGPQREEAIHFLLSAQTAWISLPQSLAAAQAYREAKTATDSVNQTIGRLRLTPGFPPGSKCRLCEPFVSPTPSGTDILLGS